MEIANIFKDNPDVSGLGLGSIGWLLGIGCVIVSLPIARKFIWKSIFAAASSVGFIIAAGGGILKMLGAGGIWAILLGWLLPSQNSNSSPNIGSGVAGVALFVTFLAVIYTLFCVVWYARRPTFAIAINSKGGSDTPISISGASGWGIFNVSAGKALTAEPAEDAERMLQELGAVILDVQMLGDMGINKWKSL